MTGKKPGRPPKKKATGSVQTDDNESQTDDNTEVIDGAVGGSTGEPETRTPIGGQASGQPGEQSRLGSEYSNLLKTIEKGPNSKTGRDLNSHGTNSPRISRPNSPSENMARLHQSYLDKIEAMGARQATLEHDFTRMVELLVDISRKVNRLCDSNSVQEGDNPNGNRTQGGHLGDLTEKVDRTASSRRNNGAVPKRILRSTNQNEGNPIEFRSEFARDLNQTSEVSRPDSVDRNVSTIEKDTFGRFYEKTKHFDSIHVPQSNPNTRLSSRDRDSVEGSRLIGNYTQSGPRESSQKDHSKSGCDPVSHKSGDAGQVLRNCLSRSGPGPKLTDTALVAAIRDDNFEDYVKKYYDRHRLKTILADHCTRNRSGFRSA